MHLRDWKSSKAISVVSVAEMFNQMFNLLEIQRTDNNTGLLAEHCSQELIIVHAFGVPCLRHFKKVNSQWKRCLELFVYLFQKCVKNLLHW